MTIEIKQSTAVTFLLGPFVDSTDGVVPETGLATNMDNASTGIRVSKNGAAQIDRNSATAPTHDDDGFYRVELSTTDTNTLGFLQVQYEESGVTLPAWKDFSVVTANYWDSKYGTDKLEVDLIQMGGVVQSATDLKDFADDGYDPATNKVQGVLLTDTVTTLTGHTPQTADHTAGIADIPTVAEFNARTILSASYFDPATDTVANVTLVATTTTNSDMRGTDSALLAANTPTNFSDLAITLTTGLVSVGTMAANVLNAAAIAANAFEAGKFNANSLDGKGDWNIGKTGYTLTQVFPTNFADLSITVTNGRVDMGTVLGSVINALVGGRMDSSVGNMATDVLTALALNADAVDEIRDGLLPTQNATFSDIPFLFVAASDHVTPVTGASTITITRSLDGAAFGAVSGTTVTEIGNGMYHIDASAADMNGGKVLFRIAATGGTPGAPDDAFVTIITGGGV